MRQLTIVLTGVIFLILSGCSYTYSSNNHIISANENIRMAIKSLKEKGTVALEGFLVNVSGKYGDTDVWWNSSLSRSDTGDSSCEVFYVTKVRNGEYVYE